MSLTRPHHCSREWPPVGTSTSTTRSTAPPSRWPWRYLRATACTRRWVRRRSSGAPSTVSIPNVQETFNVKRVGVCRARTWRLAMARFFFLRLGPVRWVLIRSLLFYSIWLLQGGQLESSSRLVSIIAFIVMQAVTCVDAWYLPHRNAYNNRPSRSQGLLRVQLCIWSHVQVTGRPTHAFPQQSTETWLEMDVSETLDATSRYGLKQHTNWFYPHIL